METVLAIGAVGFLLLCLLGLVLHLACGLLRAVVQLLLLPVHLLGGALALFAGIVALPFVVTTFVAAILAVLAGALILPMLPLVLLVLAAYGLAKLLRRQPTP